MSASSPLDAARGEAHRRRQAGDLAGAAATLLGALEMVRPAYGAEHPEVLAASHDLARVYMAAGEPALARRVLEDALAAGQRRSGDSDPLLLAISFDLGTVAEELGNRHEARRNFGRVAAAGPAVLGHDHWAVREARAYLGAVENPVPPPAPALGPAPVRTHAPALPPAPPPAPPPTPSPDTTAEIPLPVPPRDPRTLSPHVQERAQSWPSPVPPPQERVRRGRGAALAAGVAAVAAVVAAVLASIAVLDDDGSDDATPPTATVSVDGDPPTDVKITRDGDALVLTWTDPAPGEVSFVITGGKEGEELRFVGQVASGSAPRFPVYGYNPTLTYCFQIAAVYSVSQLGVAQPVCTSDVPTR